MRPINQAGLELIMSFESFSAEAYQDQGDVWTIGYGHTKDVTRDSAPISEEQASELLLKDIATAQEQVARFIMVPLTDNQYAALVSLVYNAGTAPLVRLLGAKLNAEDYAGAANEFLRWRLSGGMVSDGLVRRREAERKLFLA